ncbi:uncharacterized protein LOC131695011 [Topomyia yanbarensis]|uniref:uncharacterized protein LOC131695011 n=1 Tax=Topomyia yanbarensis TaxID=2498891 RepID=UPI00273BB250|nr:uncharacterized protein LOC131695011 [Topomyia yanbarensis]
MKTSRGSNYPLRTRSNVTIDTSQGFIDSHYAKLIKGQNQSSQRFNYPFSRGSSFHDSFGRHSHSQSKVVEKRVDVGISRDFGNQYLHNRSYDATNISQEALAYSMHCVQAKSSIGAGSRIQTELSRSLINPSSRIRQLNDFDPDYSYSLHVERQRVETEASAGFIRPLRNRLYTTFDTFQDIGRRSIDEQSRGNIVVEN